MNMQLSCMFFFIILCQIIPTMKKTNINTTLLIWAALHLCVIDTACSGTNKNDDHSIHNEETHEHAHSGLIKFDDHKAKEFGVRNEKIDASEFSDAISVSGQIESKAADEGIVTATRSGIFMLSPNINTGVKVSAGSAIGNIRVTSVQGSDPSVEATAVRDAAKRELDRLTPLHKDGVISTKTYNEALAAYEQAEAALKSTRQGSTSVVSPKSGVITQLLVKSGEYVEAGQKVAVISGNMQLILRADVPEKYIRNISTIETANFRVASSDETFSLGDLNGKILSSGSAGIAENGYITLYFSFDNNGKITPGSFAEINLISGKRKSVISVPKEAIVEISGNKCVYTRHGEGLYEKHVVATGASDGIRVEIKSGLNSGEDVVVKGAQTVRMAETSATAVPGHTHNH